MKNEALAFGANEWGSSADAMQARNRHARQLRKSGRVVKCSKSSFSDLARDEVFYAATTDGTSSPLGDPIRYVRPQAPQF